MVRPMRYICSLLVLASRYVPHLRPQASVSVLIGNNPKRRPILSKHRTQIANESLRLFVRGEMPPAFVLGLKDDVAEEVAQSREVGVQYENINRRHTTGRSKIE